MNSESQQSFQEELRKSRQKQEGSQNIFTLLADLNEAHQKQNKADSPLRKYLKELQQKDILKQNVKMNNNRSQSAQNQISKNQFVQSLSSHQENKKNFYHQSQKYDGGCQGREKSYKQSRNICQKEPRKPGIYFYKKTINLNQAPELWPSLNQSNQYQYQYKNDYFGNGEKGLFGQALTNKNFRRQR